ncbi:c-type cytochrome [Segetibacter koreensis]|uniref:c-type cytochrome n=1 Tax=Segetibacter koreensis TaxID=398037 RepID=UPI00035ED86B|nr:c-type cytochrome [Segetibacter koreensis]
MQNKRLKAFLLIGCFYLFIIVEFVACNSSKTPDKNWTAPADANELKSPFKNTMEMEEKGHNLYNIYCRTCHGETGFGDGAAGSGFDPKPANFHRDRVQKQTDGAIFYKLSNGRGPMPAFKNSLSEEQRWQLVSFIRKIPDIKASSNPPKALRPDIKVDHIMEVDSFAVRILHNPVTGDLWYTTFDGNVFQIKNLKNGQPKAEKIFTAKDHGIPRLQGAAFLNNSLFLCGNVSTNDNKSTKGRMVRYNLYPSKPAEMTEVFNTVDYGSNKTIFDHGWNALEVSPDGKYIYVNSGARTDHGEVQDNGGLYPNARDNNLTSKIFRFPVDAKDVLLTDDKAKLLADGYLYAEGIRNAYDLAFDPQGNLFAVSNSADYDMPEDMFWIRQNHHYGFPWIMGGIENPQQYNDWKPDPNTDPFINRTSHSWEVKYFHTDPTFPKIPAGVTFSPGVQNLGPDANEYRGHSGKILDGDITGVTVSTFTAHCSPLGLFFDNKKILGKDFKGDGFVIRYSLGATSSMMRPFTNEGEDLLHLQLTYDKASDNYFVKTTRIVEGFKEPTDAVMIGNEVYIISYGGKGGDIWKITLPKDESGKVKTNSKKIASKN